MSEIDLNSYIARVMNLHPQEIDLSLDRMRRLLSSLENPHLKLPPVIHVAGTNGKGSTIAFIKSILKAHGYKVHSYTSPHLLDWHERFGLDGYNDVSQLQAKKQLIAKTMEEVLLVNNNFAITPFEFLTAVGFLLFSRMPADFVLLEVGLGGEFDATNVLAHIACAVITTIDFDHMEFLGNSLKHIAFAKAGIIKPQCQLVLGSTIPDDARLVIEAIANEKGATVLNLQDLRIILEDVDLGLKGEHQFQNATIAVTAIKAILPRIDKDKVRLGLENAKWPGRFQILQLKKPDATSSDITLPIPIVLDGAHNVQGVNALIKALKKYFPNYPKTCFLHIKSRKEFALMVEKLLPHFAEIYVPTFPIDGGEGMSLSEIQSISTKPIRPLESREDFLDKMLACEGVCVVTGSLFWVAECLKTLGEDVL